MVVALSFAQALQPSPLVAEAGAAATRRSSTRGDRGPILDVFFDLQMALEETLATRRRPGAASADLADAR